MTTPTTRTDTSSTAYSSIMTMRNKNTTKESLSTTRPSTTKSMSTRNTETTDITTTPFNNRCGDDIFVTTNGSIMYTQKNQNQNRCGRCHWRLTLPRRQIIKLYFKVFNFDPKLYSCVDSTVTATVGESVVGIFCSQMTPINQEIVVKTDHIRIDASIFWKTKYNDGFEIVYELV